MLGELVHVFQGADLQYLKDLHLCGTTEDTKHFSINLHLIWSQLLLCFTSAEPVVGINRLGGHIINLVKNIVLWHFLCLSDDPYDWYLGNYYSPNLENTLDQSGCEQLVHTTRYNILNSSPQNRSCATLKGYVIAATDSTHGREATMAPKPIPTHLNWSAGRWVGMTWLYSASSSSKLLPLQRTTSNARFVRIYVGPRRHGSNQLPECSCLQPVRTCQLFSSSHSTLELSSTCQSYILKGQCIISGLSCHVIKRHFC